MRLFEAHYYPCRLVRALSATPGIGPVYVSPVSTPAADYVVKGRVRESNGRYTGVDIEVFAADGRKVMSKSFSVMVSSADWKKNPDAAGAIWGKVANGIAKIKQTPGQLALARVGGYTTGGVTPINDTHAKYAFEGAKVEREKVLALFTNNLVKKAVVPAVDEKYITWQRESTPLVEKRSNQKAAMATSMILGLASAGLGGYAASQGAYTPSMATSVNQTTQAASANMEVAAAEIAQINQTLASMSLSASLVIDRPIYVELYNRTYKLVGSPDQQLRELHRVVAEKIKTA